MKYAITVNGKQFEVEIERLPQQNNYNSSFAPPPRTPGGAAAAPGGAGIAGQGAAGGPVPMDAASAGQGAAGPASTGAGASGVASAGPSSAGQGAAGQVSTGPVSTGAGASGMASTGPGPASEIRVTAPMPGNVLDVLVSAGQHVSAGDNLLMLEAMKMENEIVAPCNGTVQQIAVKKSDTVETNTLLVILSQEG